jgi:hypothetical protein
MIHSAMTDRPQKITFAEMRDMGVRGVLIYCADYRCSHSTAVSADLWPEWVVLIAGSTGTALRAVRPPNRYVTPGCPV